MTDNVTSKNECLCTEGLRRPIDGRPTVDKVATNFGFDCMINFFDSDGSKKGSQAGA